jgi:hypothetical protein
MLHFQLYHLNGWHTSRGTGRTDGLKLYNPILSIPIQSAKSRAFARAVDNPITLTGDSVWDEIYLIRDTIFRKSP